MCDSRSGSLFLSIRLKAECAETLPNIKTKPPEIRFYIRGRGFNIGGRGLKFLQLSCLIRKCESVLIADVLRFVYLQEKVLLSALLLLQYS